jgi:CIC family chloride channel protein
MIATSSHHKTATDGHGSLLVLELLSLIVGVGAGLVGAAFRMALGGADRARNTLISWAHGSHWSGLLLVVTVITAAVALAAWLVTRFAPAASGSGIPHVEAVLRGETQQVPLRLIPVKFIGGLLAIGAGLALGREGPHRADGREYRQLRRSGL